MFQETLNQLFPSWQAVQRYREVVIFTTGLMKDPTPLLQHIYEMYIKDYLNWMRAGDLLHIDKDLFKSMYSECTVPLPEHMLHNKFINYYNLTLDDLMNRPGDTTPIYFPSRVYHFGFMKEVPTLSDIKEQEAEIPECAMTIFNPDVKVMESLLTQCQMISEHQPVTDLFMDNVYCDGASAEALKLSKSMQSLSFWDCKLLTHFMRDIFQQLHDCVTLRLLRLWEMDLRKVEKDLDRLLDNLVSYHEKGSSQTKLKLVILRSKLSEDFLKKWNERCKGIGSIDCHID